MKKQEQIILLTAGLVLIAAVAKARPTSGSGTNYNSGYSDDLMLVSFLGESHLPRGMRNNNPGNLRISSSSWQGKIPINQNTDGAFEQFSAYAWGVRAMIRLILNYIANGHNTIRKIIDRYAPASENNTTAYINAISQATGIHPDSRINNDQATLNKLIIAMSHHENGRAAVDIPMFNLAWSLL